MCEEARGPSLSRGGHKAHVLGIGLYVSKCVPGGVFSCHIWLDLVSFMPPSADDFLEHEDIPALEAPEEVPESMIGKGPWFERWC